MPFNPVSAVLGLVAMLGVLGGVWWVVDSIGDRREAKVRGEYAEAARRKNIEIGKLNSADDAVAALMEAALASKAAAASMVISSCPATKEQSRALTAIRRLR
mgnify:CR=1 FL=1